VQNETTLTGNYDTLNDTIQIFETQPGPLATHENPFFKTMLKFPAKEGTAVDLKFEKF
jgi:hypothetical protein